LPKPLHDVLHINCQLRRSNYLQLHHSDV
jgi:hypothetical protein